MIHGLVLFDMAGHKKWSMELNTTIALCSVEDWQFGSVLRQFEALIGWRQDDPIIRPCNNMEQS